MFPFTTVTVRAALQRRYPNYDALPSGEKVLLAMAYLCDDIKPRETSGANRGPAVDAIVRGNGGSLGDSWCAHSIGFCCLVARVSKPPLSAAVSAWKDWAEDSGKLRETPKRGYLCFKKSDGISHIGIVKGLDGGNVLSIEGNTSAGVHGSQSNGDGCYRRERDADFWDGYIEL